MAMKKRNKALMITGIVVASIALLLFAGGLYLKSRAGEIIEREFAKMTHDRYRLTSGNVSVSLFNRSVTFSDIGITSNEATTSVDEAPNNRTMLDFSAEELFVAGIRYRNKDGKTDIGLRRVELKKPRVKVAQMPGSAGNADSAVVSPLKIDIKRIVISEGYVEHSQMSRNDTVHNVIEGFELQTDRLLVNTEKGAPQSLLGDNTRLSVTKIRHLPADGSVRMELDSLYVETGAGLVRIGSFAQVPTYIKDEFARKAWMHKDWLRSNFAGISCHGVDFERLLAVGELHIDSVYLAQGGYSSYKNRNVARTEWIKPMHYQSIQRIPVPFAVRKGVIGSVDAQYEELKLGGDKPGIITFNNINGEIEELSNIPTPERKYSEWRLHASMMGVAPLTVTGFMPIDSLNDRFELMVVLGRTNANVLNPMIVPLNNIEISSGVIDKMDFHIIGNSRTAAINMMFLYHDLDIMLLKEKDGKIKGRGFLSGVVNRMVLLNSNPLYGETRASHETNQRDPYRSPWNYLWRTIFAGAKETIGLGKL